MQAALTNANHSVVSDDVIIQMYSCHVTVVTFWMSNDNESIVSLAPAPNMCPPPNIRTTNRPSEETQFYRSVIIADMTDNHLYK